MPEPSKAFEDLKEVVDKMYAVLVGDLEKPEGLIAQVHDNSRWIRETRIFIKGLRWKFWGAIAVLIATAIFNLVVG